MQWAPRRGLLQSAANEQLTGPKELGKDRRRLVRPSLSEGNMSIILTKGQRVDVQLRKVHIGLGWDPNASASSFEYDLDASAFMLDARRKVPSDRCFVFYNNQVSDDGAVSSSGDDRSGGNSEGDDETLTVELPRVRSDVQEIVFVVTIHEAAERRQNFGQVRNAFIRVVDADSNKEMFKYELDEDFSACTAVEFGRLYRRGDGWRFEALGQGSRRDLTAILTQFR